MYRIISIILLFLSGSLVFISCSKNHIGEVNIAEYAKEERNEIEITLQWEEPRDIYKVVVKASDPSELINNKIQYWQNNWPQKRIPKGEVNEENAGSLGWMAQDDWFNGQWKEADIKTEINGESIIYTFNPLNTKEFPEEDFDAVYRRSLKIRFPLEGVSSEIQKIEVFSNSVWKETEVKIEWGDEIAEENWEGHFEIYNGELQNIDALSENITTEDKFKFRCDDNHGSVKLRLRYSYNDDQTSFDRTIVTLRSREKSFSFLVSDVVSGEKIFLKDYDILVTEFEDDIKYTDFKQNWEVEHVKSLYERVKELPEQTYENAKNDMPEKKERGFMPLGCEGGRQKFGIDVSGDVFYRKYSAFANDPGKDSDRLLWRGNQIRYSFGLPDVEPIDRHLEDGYLPVIQAKWETRNITYVQTTFVTLFGSDILSGERMQGDDPTILLAKVTLTNSGDESQEVKLNLTSTCDISEKLVEKDGFVYATNYEQNRMRYFINTEGKGSVKSDDINLYYQIVLTKNESHSIYFKIPFITLTEENEFDLVKNTVYSIELPKVKKYWNDRISKGTKINTPNETLNNFYRAHLTHMLITDDREVASDRYASRVGTFPYDVYPNESIMCISDFSRRNYKEEAEERLELLLHYQGSRALPGNYTDNEGVFYGAGGYTEGNGYNKHHGWVLWGLAEHYLYYRDKEWLNRVAPSIVKGCDWIIRQRENTMKYEENGEKTLEYGFLPAGSLEDVHDYKYWLSTNANTYFGFNNAAKALADINHPESKRLVEEAKKYKDDLLRGFTESMVRSPVVKLRDGTYVPHVPSRLYNRGREFGWIREVLEGALHLIDCRILEPWDEISTWIIKDYEDNLYISDKSEHVNQYGYTIENFDQNWFSLGGFSMQSNLLSHPVPYILRDEPENFLRGYFNAFTSVFYPDICACVEHALPTLADNNGVWFKPSDEAQSTSWLRLMFVRENGEDLYLGQAIPRYWLSDGSSIGIESAATHFGSLSLQIKSESNKDQITVLLNPPKRNSPKNIYLRIRHPDSKLIRSITINGKDYKNFDPNKEWISLPGNIKEIQKLLVKY